MPPSPPRPVAVRAIDTNIVIRILTGDDQGQADKARELIAKSDIFVATTVFLECEWVLRSAYGFPGDQIVAGLRAFAGLPRVQLEDPALVSQALDWAERGMDFADALHLGGAEGCSSFVTFDRKLAKAATAESATKVIIL